MTGKAPRANVRKTPRKHAIGHLPPRKSAEVKGGSLNAYFEEVTGEKQGQFRKK
jgi:hypothetical protein